LFFVEYPRVLSGKNSFPELWLEYREEINEAFHLLTRDQFLLLSFWFCFFIQICSENNPKIHIVIAILEHFVVGAVVMVNPYDEYDPACFQVALSTNFLFLHYINKVSLLRFLRIHQSNWQLILLSIVGGFSFVLVLKVI